MQATAGKSVALAVTGSIAAYKAVEVARRLIKAGVKVIPLMTKSAEKFVGPATKLFPARVRSVTSFS